MKCILKLKGGAAGMKNYLMEVYFNCTKQKEELSKRVEELLEFKVYLRIISRRRSLQRGLISMGNYFTRRISAIVIKQKQVQQYSNIPYSLDNSS